MRILLINKFFYPRAGAETAFFHTRELLRSHGHDVVDFAMEDPQNDASAYAGNFSPRRTYDAGLLSLPDAVATVYSLKARRALGRLLDATRPDVAHLHNVYHQLTLSIVDELHARRIPIVQTLHDYKIACPAYTLYTNGAPCRRCVDGTVLNAVRHRCIKDSAAASALGAMELALARRRRTYDKVDRIIAPSRFVAAVAEMGGVESDRVTILPNLLPSSELASALEVRRDRPPSFFFGGRLDETKGVRQLLEAFSRVSVPATLRIAGWGAMQEDVEAAATADSRIEFLGSLGRAEVLDHLTKSRALVLPSTWEENCPLIMLEAQARGTPVIASDRGGLPEFVEDQRDGLIVDPDDVEALARAISTLAADPVSAKRMGAAAHAAVGRRHRPDDHYAGLLQAYERAAERSRGSASGGPGRTSR